MIIVFFGFILRILITLILILDGQSTLTYDSIRFHEEALLFDQFIIDKLSNPELEYPYKNYFPVIIGYFYHFTGIKSYLISTTISSLAWLFSAIILLKMMKALSYKKKSINIVLILYTFIFPTGIVYSSLLLREVYILLFINLLAFYFIIISENDRKNKFINFVLISIISIILLFLHSANFFFLIVLFSCLVFLYFVKKIRINKISIIILGLSSIIFLDFYGVLEKIFIYIKVYLQGHFFENNFERATYYTMEEINSLQYSITSFLVLVVKNFINYLFQPFIHKVSSFKDLILLIENIFRLVLICMTINNFRKNFVNKEIFIILLLMYVIMEFIYAQATVNWGTASRHHLPSLGLLVMIAYFPFIRIKKN